MTAALSFAWKLGTKRRKSAKARTSARLSTSRNSRRDWRRRKASAEEEKLARKRLSGFREPRWANGNRYNSHLSAELAPVFPDWFVPSRDDKLPADWPRHNQSRGRTGECSWYCRCRREAC